MDDPLISSSMRETLHPSNRLDRSQRHEKLWQARKKEFFVKVAIFIVLLQLLFLGNMSYLYGSIWKSQNRYNSFKVLFVDYDQGVVGRSVMQAYEQLEGPSFPTFIQHTIEEYPSTNDLVQAVRKNDYWAAFVSNQNASDRLAIALLGGQTAQTYDPTTALTYVWNEVRYPPFSDEAFQASFKNLAAATRLQYNRLNGTKALQSMNNSDAGALEVLFNPIAASDINVMPTTQATKLFYNTVSLGPMPVLQNFFYLLVLNGLSFELQLYSKLPLHISGLVRLSLSVTYDLLASVSLTGYIWAFRETWSVTPSQFVLTWLTLWLLFHIHYLYLDACTAFFPLPALPFILLTWIILNITSTISPFDTNPAFYRWSYVLPANEAYTVLQDIWSGGAVPQLYRALPVLFAWWVGGLALATYAHFYRCHKAWQMEAKMDASSKALRYLKEGPEEPKSKNNPRLPTPPSPLALETPTEALLEAAEQYRSAYGPSIAPPLGWWRSAATATADAPDYERITHRPGSSPGLSLWKPLMAAPDSPHMFQNMTLNGGSGVGGGSSIKGRESPEPGRLFEDGSSTIVHEGE